jgi:Mce-associated membrane protein
MKSGQDAGVLAAPAQAAEDDAPAVGAADDMPAAGAEPAVNSGDSAKPDRPAGAPLWMAAMAVLCALLIAGIVVAVVFGTHVRRFDAQSSRRQDAVAAARNAVADLTTADYQHPQQYVDRLKAEATGNFLSLFTNSAAGFKDVLVQGKVQTTGHVVDVGVQKVGADTAELTVLAYVTVKNSQTPNGAQRAYRLSVSMILAGSHWLVSNVKFVQ